MLNLEDLREIARTAARGHNVVAVTPPSSAYAESLLGGILATVSGGRRGLVLCPAAELDEWGALAYSLAGADGPRIHVAHGTARAMRRLKAGTVDLLIAAPEIALLLHQRAVLKVDGLASVFLAWPETWAGADDDALAPLMQDLPKESQRVIVTALPDRVQDLVVRYAWKALTAGLPNSKTPEPPAGPVRTVSVPWARRVAALADVIELVDPSSCAIWTVDTSRHDDIRRAIALGSEIHLVTGDAPAVDVVVAFDLPTPERLRQLVGAGEVLLLVPPTAEGYVDRIAAPRRPLRLPGLLDTVTTRAGARRATIVSALEAGNPERALLTLAPLFERYDPTAVAAALYELWTAPGVDHAPAAIPDIPATARIYVGLGKKDGVTVNDVVATLTKDVRVERTKIGKIEVRDAFTLVELPAQDAEDIARALSGTTIRRKRVTARIDRGRERPARASGSPAPSRRGRPGTQGPSRP